MPENVKPSLSPTGWITSSAARLDDLLADFYYAEYSQSHFYSGVASLPWIIQNNRNDPVGTSAAINKTLYNYLIKYFTKVNVNASTTIDPTSPNKSAIRLGITVMDSTGKEISVSKILYTLDSKLQKAIDANNG